MNLKPIRIAIFLSALWTLFGNFAGNAVFGGLETGEMSDLYSTQITPAGYTFAVWGPIFVGVVVYAVYQLLPRTQNSALLDRLSPYVLALNLMCGIWPIFFGQEQFVIAHILIMAMLVSLFAIFVMILNTERERGLVSAEKWAVKLPFSLYFAWLTVANVVSQALLFVTRNWDGFGISPVVWSVVVLTAVLAITTFVIAVSRGNLGYTGVIVWAMGGILVANLGVAPIMAMAVLIAVVAIIVAALSRPRQPQLATA